MVLPLKIMLWQQGVDSLYDPLALLESSYYGSQYILQSAGRNIGKGHSGRVSMKSSSF